MSFVERCRRTRDWAALSSVKFIPKRIRYWTVISEVGKATMKSPNVPATPLSEILNNLDAPKGMS